MPSGRWTEDFIICSSPENTASNFLEDRQAVEISMKSRCEEKNQDDHLSTIPDDVPSSRREWPIWCRFLNSIAKSSTSKCTKVKIASDSAVIVYTADGLGCCQAKRTYAMQEDAPTFQDTAMEDVLWSDKKISTIEEGRNTRNDRQLISPMQRNGKIRKVVTRSLLP